MNGRKHIENRWSTPRNGSMNKMSVSADHTLDLGFVNYVQHPENSNYSVFRFYDDNRAASFELALTEQKIWFEKAEEERKGKMVTLFGIHNNDFKKAEKINYKVEAMHKKRLIPGRIFRTVLLLFSFTALTLAIIGYCKAPKIDLGNNKTNTSINR